LVIITHDVNVAALARACYRLESGVLSTAEVPSGVSA
jgi:putative ABC transport system ATP-binding protein